MRFTNVDRLFKAAFFILFLSCFTPGGQAGRRRHHHKGIHELKGLEGFNYLESKKKASECKFGDRRYELEEIWHPDLGPPFGVMYCVQCQCVPIHKKRRIVGRVRCKNIKTECPIPTCSNPVLLPKRCCKVCPGQFNNPDLNIQVNLIREEEEKNGRHYAALLSNGTSLTPTNSKTSATGRFYFRKKTLSYSFVTSPDFGWPKLLTFLDEEGNIIEEFPLQITPFQNFTGKVCGTWNRLPRRYRRQLRRDQIFAQLTSSVTNDIISGRIGKYYGLGSELFSSLLRSKNGGPEAGTAITSLSTSATGTGGVHVMLLLSGIFDEREIGSNDVPIRVTFECHDGTETRTIAEDVKAPRASNELVTMDFKTVFDSPEMSALGQGRLKITVTSKGSPERSISSYLVPRFSCDYFDTSMSPLQANFEDASSEDGLSGEESSSKPSPEESPYGVVRNYPSDTGARGVFWMHMTDEGEIKYRMKIKDLSGEITSIQIDNGRKSRRLLKVVADLFPTYEDGWANGTLSLPAEDIVDLYHEDLYVNVETTNQEHELRGRIIRHLKTGAQDGGIPILLAGNRTTVTGIGWVHIDSTCTLSYEVRLSGREISKREEFYLELVDFPMRSLKTLPLLPEKRLDLQKFRGPEAEGHASGLHKLTMARMDYGDAALVVSNSVFKIEGKISNIIVPPDCLPRYRRNELELIPGYLSDTAQERYDEESTRCLYQEHSVYEEGDQWTATHQPCSMCSCRRGKVVCDPIICPETNCDNPLILEGECCASCPSDVTSDSSLGCVFSGDKKFHIAGTKWHPYIPPFGFSRCTICTCDAGTLEVKCANKECPPLDCPPERQVKNDSMACCEICAEPKPVEIRNEESRPQDHSLLKDMGRERTKEEILGEGGCQWRGELYNNGDSWHPNVMPFGEMKCVNCKCKDGKAKCMKKICDSLTCLYQILDRGKCCPRCAVSRAEVRKFKKIRRLEKIRRIRRRRKFRNKTSY